MQENNIFNTFTNLDKKSLTLRFALKPVGKTSDVLKKYWEEIKDEERNLAYPIVKQILDREYQKMISDTLMQLEEDASIDWSVLAELLENNVGNSNRTKILKEQASLRKKISNALKGNSVYKKLSGKEAFGKNGYLLKQDLSEEEKKAVYLFDGFSTYFTNFYLNRDNYFSNEAKSTAIANRIVNENFVKHISNINIMDNVIRNAPDFMESVIKEVGTEDWISLFSVNSYNLALSQKGIDTYNEVVGIYNKLANLYMQKNAKRLPEGNPFKKRKTSQLSCLFKQIASDKEKTIMIDSFENDAEVFETLDILEQKLDEMQIIEKLNSFSKEKDQWDYGKVYIASKSLNEVSAFIGKESARWGLIENALEKSARQLLEKKYTGKRLENELDKSKKLYYSMLEIQNALDDNTEIDVQYNVSDWLMKIQELISQLENARQDYVLYRNEKEHTPLKESDVKELKTYLDVWLQVIRYCKSFLFDGIENSIKEEGFYNILDECIFVLEDVLYVYNKIRNYITKKPYSLDKMVLKFANPTLAAGWMTDKEKTYGTVILRRHGKYYLAVSNAIKQKISIDSSNNQGEDDYQKIIYSQFKDVSKMIPKCSTQVNAVKAHFEDSDETFVLNSDKFIKPLVVSKEEFDLNNKLYDGGKKKWQKDYLKNTNDVEGYEDAVKKWNKFCMRFLLSYKSTADYDYSQLLPLEEYKTVDSLYKDLDKLLYRISYEYVPVSKINSLVENEEIFLFEIYNKDFSQKRKIGSKKNLHTLYWEALFSDENKEANVIKLNGGAEIFFRKSSIKNPSIHKAGEVLVNKRTKCGEPIPNAAYMDLYHYFNGREDLVSDIHNVEMYKDNVYKTVKKYDIVKDRRFTKDAYEFHVPITINYQSSGASYLNSRVLKILKDNPNVNIIGLDRGERNLISYVVINQQGKIIDNQQGSFNIVKKMDYQKKLYQREKERDTAKKSWQTIENIKELKEGYISQVVHELAELMIKNNAIIVMEDLNYGFKRGRFKVERQVYQKFEMALIKKLQYLVLDKQEGSAMLQPGGVLNGYQLTTIPSSLKDVGRQCGIIFYVPPAYTSKIDPITGFVNVFNMSDVKNRNAKKRFFSKFDDIFYDKELDMFGFSFDYRNFSQYRMCYKTNWTVYSNGNRYVWSKKEKKEVCYDITKSLKNLFEKNSISYKENLYEGIMQISDDISNAEFWENLHKYFCIMLRLRNSSSLNQVDQIISPVRNRDGKFFVTPEDIEGVKSEYPIDADTNGAYHIALKGLFLISERLKDFAFGKDNRVPTDFYKISASEWFEYRQKE